MIKAKLIIKLKIYLVFNNILLRRINIGHRLPGWVALRHVAQNFIGVTYASVTHACASGVASLHGSFLVMHNTVYMGKDAGKMCWEIYAHVWPSLQCATVNSNRRIVCDIWCHLVDTSRWLLDTSGATKILNILKFSCRQTQDLPPLRATTIH